jgi:hypothetical protein
LFYRPARGATGTHTRSARTPRRQTGSSSLSGEIDLFQWQHSYPQQFDACAAEHGPLESFQSVDLAFGLATAPWFGDGVPDGVDVAGQYSRELL